MMLLPEPATTGGYQNESNRKKDRSNVFHGSKVASLLTSTPDRSHLGKTMTLFSCDEYHVRCCGWLKGLAERAICEYSPAIGSLKKWVRLNSEH
jgi:hypothetical protein